MHNKSITVLYATILFYAAGVSSLCNMARATEPPSNSILPPYSTQSDKPAGLRPFNRMVGNMVPLAEEVVVDTQNKQAENKEPETSNPASNTNSGQDGAVAEKPNPVSPEAQELQLPDIEAPILSEPGKNDKSNGQPQHGAVYRLFNDKEKAAESQGNKPVSVVVPRKKHIKTVTTTPPPKEKAKPKNTEPSPVARPDNNYRTQTLPWTISKKSYSRENQHLPKAIYNEEYRKILFDSAGIGNLDILRAMIDDARDTEIRDAEGNTPLIYASMAGNLQSVITLISMSANINAQNTNGISPLYAATKLGRIDLVQFILSNMAMPDLGDRNDTTPLMIAAEMDLSGIAGLLIKYGADINRKMKNGNTPIHLAIQNSSMATANLLITKNADIDIRNFKGYTPLMLAVEMGQEAPAALLLNAGADISKTNARGYDIAAIANNTGNRSMIELIESDKIRRKFIAQKLLDAKKPLITEQPNNLKTATPVTGMKAKRVNGIPLPFIRPVNTANRPEHHAHPPKPFFSKAEKEKMGDWK